jgi:hypothetical protein
MNRSDVRLIIGSVLAVVVPAAFLDLGNDEGRRAAELSAAPFAWRGILLAHLVAALPLGLVLAAWVRSLPAVASSTPWPWVLLGSAMAGLGAAMSPELGDAIARSEFAAFPLLLLRSGLAFVLVMPWCVAAFGPATGTRRPWPLGIAFGIALGLAVTPCALYAEVVAAARTEETAALLTQKRLAKAEGMVTGLCELGSERPINMMAPAEVRKQLTDTLRTLRWEANEPFPTTLASPADRLSRAVLLVQIERLDEAAALLRPLVPGDDTATLMLAAVYQNQQRWAESDALYAAILEKLLPLAPTENAARDACRTAFDGLADNARKADRPADAEAVLDRGLHELPADAAHFHFLLGRHYHEAGRSRLALDHLRTAAQLDQAGLGAPTDDLIRRIRTSTPGCLEAGSP